MIFQKIQKAIKDKRFFNSFFNYFRPIIIGFCLFFLRSPFKKDKFKIFISKQIKPDNKDNPLFERLFKSYKKMSGELETNNSIFNPSKMWSDHIEKDYKFLKNSLKNDDFDKFKFFVSNFGNWDNYLGIERNIFIKRLNANFLSRKFLKVMIFERIFNFWKLINSTENYKVLDQPKYGNQIGAKIDDTFVTIGSFFNHIISKNLSNLIKKARPVVTELGGGYGRLAYYLLKNKKNFCYLSFDLPEVLILSAYYLSKSFPEKKLLLYGEKNFDEESIKKFDFIFMPSFEIDKLNENSTDLFINKNSLGEMNKEQVDHFCKKISLTSKYFFHMNHDFHRVIFPDKKEGYLANEYPIKDKMQLIYKYIDLGHLLQDGHINFKNDIMMYLYKKIKSSD